jgi:hypothetical protein
MTVVTEPRGQFVTVSGHLVIVLRKVVKTVEVVIAVVGSGFKVSMVEDGPVVVGSRVRVMTVEVGLVVAVVELFP